MYVLNGGFIESTCYIMGEVYVGIEGVGIWELVGVSLGEGFLCMRYM